MKLIMILAGLVMMTGINPGDVVARVDGAKWHAFVNRVLERVANRADADGRTPVTGQKFVARYDADGDGFIDRSEAKVIKDYLATKKPAVVEKVETVKEEAVDKPMPKEKKEKKEKKYGW